MGKENVWLYALPARRTLRCVLSYPARIAFRARRLAGISFPTLRAVFSPRCTHHASASALPVNPNY